MNTTHLFQIHLDIILLLRLGFPKLFPSGLPTKPLHAFLDSSICVTCPGHLSRLELRFLIMLGEEHSPVICLS